MPKTESNLTVPVKKRTGITTEKKTEPSVDLKLNDVLKIELHHIHHFEEAFISFLPSLIEQVSDEDLEEFLNDFYHQNKRQLERLDKVLVRSSLKNHENIKCSVLQSYVEEIKPISENYINGSTKDAAVIIQLQKMIHHKVSSYGSICELADVLKYHRIADSLDRTLLECENADVFLSSLAEEINQDALQELAEPETI